jgi:hypothetical protein
VVFAGKDSRGVGREIVQAQDEKTQEEKKLAHDGYICEHFDFGYD